MLLRQKDKQTLHAIFISAACPIEVWAYGSRVNGTAHEGSDLDLVVRTHDGKKLPMDVFMKLKEKITESNIPIVVELYDWARLPESFHTSINARHEVLFSSNQWVVNEPRADYKKKK